MHVDGWTDLGGRALFLLQGPDAERFLNGQTTHDARRATADAALPSLVTNAKGKVEAELHFSRHPFGEGFLLDAPSDLREALFLRLDRYLIADDAALGDVTAEYRLLHVLGPVPPLPPGVVRRRADRFGVPGTDLLAPASAGFGLPGPALPEATLEALRISRGLARWGTELGPGLDVFPQEARLEDRAVDFHKGCYIGQEVISRIKSAGKVNRLLCALVAEAPDLRALRPGVPLFREEREVGAVTSVAWNEDLSRLTALAYVKRDASDPGTVLGAGPDPEKRLSTRLEIRKTPLCS
jgi:folate-binding protein YgfZ